MAPKVNSKGNISLRALFPHKNTSSVKSYSVEHKDGKVILKLYDEYLNLIKDLPTAKPLRCSKNLKAMTRTATQGCFDRAMKEVRTKYKGEAKLTDESFKEKHMDEIDNAYRHNICKLETDVLESILLLHNKNKFHRAKITLNAINDELTRRAILDDSARKK